MHLNRVCNLKDFKNAAFRTGLDDIFGESCAYDGKVHRKSAEIANAVMALRQGGATRPGARVLGIGAGKEPTIFHLTRFAEVHATDLYLDAGVWSENAPAQMLIDPMAVELDIFGKKVFPADLGCLPERLIVQHMDARNLRYPDNHFDGVFTSSSIEHFGSREDVAAATREIGRVLKPGGIASISTEWMISGSAYMGFDGVLLFDEDAIRRYIVEPSGLEMVDTLEYEVDDETMATEVTLEDAIQHTTYPHIVLSHEGYKFTSVHLALRKPGEDAGGDDNTVSIWHDDRVVERLVIPPEVPDEKPASRKRRPKSED